MLRSPRRILAASVFLLLLALRPVPAAEVLMKDGRSIKGAIVPLPSINVDPRQQQNEAALRLIVMCDTELCRYFLPKAQIAEVVPEGGNEITEKFQIRQKVPRAGRRVANVGAVLETEPFDDFGRRTIRIATSDGPVPIVQGITRITPTYTKVEGLTHIWDQRIATSSIPREKLARILAKIIDEDDPEQRLRPVRFFVQAERYADARAELEELIKDFPEIGEQFRAVEQTLRQQSAQRIVEEIAVRRAAGQHRLAYSMVQQFPAEGVAGAILGELRGIRDGYDKQVEHGRRIQELMMAHYDQLPTEWQVQVKPILDEINAELNLTTLERLAAYERLSGDEKLQAAEKLSLAISGWLVGSNDATLKLPVAISLYEVRKLVRIYLNEPLAINRQSMLDEIRKQEAGTPDYLTKLIGHMRPPVETPEQEVPGLYRLSSETLPGQPNIDYFVQLPPEYDPYRRYPTILTLHAPGTTPLQQIDWWAGDLNKEGQRLGQATRHGYIVVSPAWGKQHQRKYGYSVYEHAAVLNSLRDACRRFSIDTDRVFLSGHSMGGDAAWDIGLAHPDLWAGVIMFTAVSDRYTNFIWENAEHVPMYLVCGELDGGKLKQNATDLDRILRRGANLTVAEYLGRGHEHFSDEILALFDWMGRYKRNFFPEEFTCRTMRSTDNFFWWVEMEDFPERVVIDPALWPDQPRGVRPLEVEGRLNATNGVNISAGTGIVRVYLTPDMVDLKQPTRVTVNGRRIHRGVFLEPDIEVLLEDVRTRADRQHPFWVKLEHGRTGVASRRR